MVIKEVKSSCFEKIEDLGTMMYIPIFTHEYYIG